MPEYDIKKMQAYLTMCERVVRCGTLTDAAIEKMKEECKVVPSESKGPFVLGFYDMFDGWTIFDGISDKEMFGFGGLYPTREEAQAVCDEKNEKLGENNKRAGERWQVFTDSEVRGRYRR